MKRKTEGSPEPSTKPAKMAKTMVEKEKKYDRQLRLWGDHGQAALEKAKAQSPAVGISCARDTLSPDGWAHGVRYCQSRPISEYQDKAKQDVAAVTQRVHSILNSIGKSTDSISESEIRIF
ncbi:NEDD8-activating enzyme E1 regulatory subunit, partial [Exaiptasia diaphana]